MWDNNIILLEENPKLRYQRLTDSFLIEEFITLGYKGG